MTSGEDLLVRLLAALSAVDEEYPCVNDDGSWVTIDGGWDRAKLIAAPDSE